MAITKRTYVDQIIVDPTTGTTLWREVTVIEEDGVELTKSFHRRSLTVGEAPQERDLPFMDKVAPFKALADTPEARTKATEIKTKAKDGLR